MIIINANLRETWLIKYIANTFPLLKDSIFGGEYNDTSRQWALNVGFIIISLMVVHLAVRILSPFI